MRRTAALLIAAITITGCASTEQYAAHRAQLDAWERVEKARADAQARRFDALSIVAQRGDPIAQVAVAFAIAGGGSAGTMQTQTAPPAVPDPDAAAYRWAALLLPTATAITTSVAGYRLGVAQSDNAAATAIAGYNTMGTLGTAGTTAATNIATAGFNTFGALPPTTQTTTTNTLNVGPGSAGAIGGAATLDNSRRCAPSYAQPITINASTGSVGSGAPGTNPLTGGSLTTPVGAITNPFTC
jgi:hypothetical protein